MYSHHHYLIPEHSYLPGTVGSHNPTPVSPRGVSGNHKPSRRLHFLNMLQNGRVVQWSSACGFSHLAGSLQGSSMLSRVSEFHSSPWQSSSCLYGSTTFCSPIHRLMDTWVGPSFWLPWALLYEHSWARVGGSICFPLSWICTSEWSCCIIWQLHT